MQTMILPRTLRATLLSTRSNSLAVRSLTLALAAAGTLLMTGCGGQFGSSTGPATTTLALHGQVHGGQQPVSGATMQLYAAGQTAYNTSATALLTTVVTTDANGNFNITGDYTCPYANSQVYLTATGGNPGGSTVNPNLSLLAALGPCGNLGATTVISVNELTTVAGAYALAPFMSTPTQLSTTPTNVIGLTNAFATVNKLVNMSSGATPGSTLPAGATEPVAELDTLADIIASCVNSGGGTAGDKSACGNLFANATPPGGTAPVDTLTATLNIAKYPANNAAALYALMLPASPFQPTLGAAPTAYTVSLRYAPTGAGALSNPTAAAIDTAGNVWVTNAGNNTISVIGAATGAPSVYSGGGLNAPSAIAFDAGGNAWVPNKGSSTLSVFTPAGFGTTALTTNLTSPSGVAIDGQGLIWVTDSAVNKVTEVIASGVTVTGSIVYTTPGTSPVAVAINPH